MVEFAWEARSPLREPFGAPDQVHASPRVRLVERTGLSLLQVMARRGRWADTAGAAASHFGVAPPAQPSAGFGDNVTLVWSGPDQFLALSSGAGDAVALDAARAALASVASVCEQSDGRFMVEIAGPNARDVLARLTVVDLEPSLFPPGAAAATAIDHTTVNLWRKPDAADGTPVYALLCLTSFAATIWHSLHEAAAEFGVSTERVSLGG